MGITRHGTAGRDSLVGTTTNDLLHGLDGDDTLNGLHGDDTLYGGNGNDTLHGDLGTLSFYGGSGNDTLLTGSAANMTAWFGRGDGRDTIAGHPSWATGTSTLQFTGALTKSDIAVSVSGDSLVLSVRGTTDSVTIDSFYNYGQPSPEGGKIGGRMTGVQFVKFADGSSWTMDDLKAIVFTGTTGNDAIRGTRQADTLAGGAGNDTLDGYGGNDVIDGGAGSDWIDGGSGNDTIMGGHDGDDTLYGSAGDDTLHGDMGTLSFYGGAGNDRLLTGGTASMTVYFGRGDGNDTIAGHPDWAASTNTLQFTGNIAKSDITVSVSSKALVLSINGTTVSATHRTADSVTIERFYDYGPPMPEGDRIDGSTTGVQLVKFADGSSWTIDDLKAIVFAGTTGHDSIRGTYLADTLTGGGGNDTLLGYGGNDSLVGGTGNDSMAGGSGNDTYVVDSTGDVVTELGGEGTDLVQASVHHILAAQVENLTLTTAAALNGTGNLLNNVLTGNAAANVLTGAGGNDTVYGLAGNDILYGSYTGADVLHGGDGNDALYGLYGHDTLYGGTGNDTLNGSWGNDTYQFSRGDGIDRLIESDNTTTSVDTLQLSARISREQVWWRKSGNDLEMSIIGTTDKVTVQNWYVGQACHVEQFRTIDGKVLLDTQVDQLVNAMAAFAPPAAGQTTLPAAYQAVLNPVIAANWK